MRVSLDTGNRDMGVLESCVAKLARQQFLSFGKCVQYFDQLGEQALGGVIGHAFASCRERTADGGANISHEAARGRRGRTWGDEHMGVTDRRTNLSEPFVTGMRRANDFRVFCWVTRYLTLEQGTDRYTCRCALVAIFGPLSVVVDVIDYRTCRALASLEDGIEQWPGYLRAKSDPDPPVEGGVAREQAAGSFAGSCQVSVASVPLLSVCCPRRIGGAVAATARADQAGKAAKWAFGDPSISSR